MIINIIIHRIISGLILLWKFVHSIPKSLSLSLSMGNRIIVVRDRRTPWNGRNCCHKPQCRGFNYEYNNNDNIFVDDDGHSRETTQTYAGW